MADDQLTRRIWPVLLGAAILLAGCEGPDKPDTKAAAAAAEKGLRTAISEAKAVQDPWTAFKQLDAAETTILRANNPCRNGTCEDVPAWKTSADLRVELLSAAIKAKRPAAFEFLYGSGATDEYKPLKQSSVPKLFEYADEAAGTAEDRPVLLLAAKFVADGNEVMRDNSKAVGYLARAWAAGEAQAANSAAQLFLRINDVRNAYLWSLRCTAGCNRDETTALNRLEEALSPEAAKQAQKVAASPSVVELDTSGG